MSDDFETTMWWGVSPGSWVTHADRLFRSAEVLWQPLQRLLDMEARAIANGTLMRDDTDYRIEDWYHIHAYLLVAGSALEAMLKAAAIQAKLNTGGFDAVLGPGRELQRWLTTHNLVAIASHAGIELTDVEREQLRRLEKYVVWAGPYPVPKSMVEHHPPQACSMWTMTCLTGMKRHFGACMPARTRHTPNFERLEFQRRATKGSSNGPTAKARGRVVDALLPERPAHRRERPHRQVLRR
jgi:hypothetical protein